MTTQIVLVPGFWLGAWAWDDVAPLLRERGYRVDALTLPGLAEASPDPGATLQDQVAEIVGVLDGDADRRVLVVHSGAAYPGTLVLDRAPGLVDHVVYVDTAPVVDGAAMDTALEGESLELSAVWEGELAGGSMRDLTEEQLQTFRERAVPQPAATVREPVALADDSRLDVPGTVVCTAFSAADYRSYADQGVPFLAGLKEFRRLDLVDLPTGHWPMWSKPTELAEVIARAAG
jgi:pimeloyl-ACP methyl ester carboxylesterase